MIVGHSFGGLIVYSVLSEARVRDITDIRQLLPGQSKDDIDAALSRSREGDLVLLVNPAIEATRFDALPRMFEAAPKWNRYHAPLFVSITSIDDLATRIAFPAGRSVSTIFELYTPGVEAAQRRANLETLGQDFDYITMSLMTLDEYNASARPGQKVAPLDTCAGYAQSFPKSVELEGHIKRDRATFAKFRLPLGQPPNTGKAYPRQFCGASELVLSLASDVDPNSPVWNITTRAPIVKDHGDITNALLWQFGRQLYYDSEYNLFEDVRRVTTPR